MATKKVVILDATPFNLAKEYILAKRDGLKMAEIAEKFGLSGVSFGQKIKKLRELGVELPAPNVRISLDEKAVAALNKQLADI